MARVEHFHDPRAPKATSLVPAVTVVVANDSGHLLLQRRVDNGLWALPGGVVEIGETVQDAAGREVAEETGMDVEITGLVGIYSDPRHVIEYSDGEVRQQFAICFAARLLGGHLQASGESSDVRFVAPEDLGSLDMHESTRLRISHFLARRPTPYIG